MTKEELYAEYCIEYPMVQGYREVTYESWLEKQVIDSRAESVNKNALLADVSGCLLPLYNSTELIELAKTNKQKCEDKSFDWRSYYNGFLDGFATYFNKHKNNR